MHINGVLKCIVWTNKVRTFLMLDNQHLPIEETQSHFRSSLMTLSISLIRSFLLLVTFSLVS